jgi:hypothetical protein
MLKNSVLIVLVVLFAVPVMGQTIIMSRSDSVTIYWDSVSPDYSGEIISYEVLLSYDGNIDTIYAGPDTTFMIDLSARPDGIYRPGVLAIDDSGNRSGVVWSDSSINESCCWLIRKDTQAPSLVGRVGMKL